MGELAQLFLAIGSMAVGVGTGIATVIVAIRSSRKQATQAAGKILDAAVDEKQDDRIAQLEKLLNQEDGEHDRP